jgi:uncharacterized membrane protein
MKTERLLLALAILSLMGIVASCFFLPETIPVHWNAWGKVDGWGNRANILWMGALPLVGLILFSLLPRIDPRREAYAKHRKPYLIFQALFVVSSIGVAWLTVAVSLGAKIKMEACIQCGTGLLMIVMGNYMGQLKRNYFVGIKTPWALADDEVWRLTHRRGAWVFIIMGLLMIVSAFLPPGLKVALILVPLIGGIVYIYLYSYLVFRSLKARKKEST